MIISNARIKFASLQTPNDDSKYTAAFFIDDAAEEKKLIAHIDAQWKEKGEGKRASSLGYKAFQPSEDFPNDADAGKTIFNASKYESEKTPQNFKFKQYDSNNLPVTPLMAIGKGSIINIDIIKDCFKYDFKGKRGLILNFNNVQIVSIGSVSEADDAAATFDKQEGGFVAQSSGFSVADF